MKTNLFKVKELEKEKITIEEEQLKHPFIYFLKKHSELLILLLLILGVSSIGIGTGLVISLVGNTGDFDISYVYGSSQINANPEDDESAERELLGDIAVQDGVVLVTEKFMTEQGDIVTYYSDGTSLIITKTGKIKRVEALEDGSYAIDKMGKINKNALRIIVTSQTITLEDGTIITYYSDGSAEITKNKITNFIRDSKNITFDEKSTTQILKNIAPSGVTYVKRNLKYNNYGYTEFFDGSFLINDNGKYYLVHNNEDVNLTSDSYSFPNNNMATIKETKKLKDGNTVDYYTDGSAIITDKNNEKILVRKSGDIVIYNDKIFEIYPNKIANAVSKVKTPDGNTITYYDNADAVIEKTDGKKEYIDDNSGIKYDNNKNIETVTSEKHEQIKAGKTPDGTQVTNFSNEKSQIIEPGGSDYITDTKDITYDIIGNIEDVGEQTPAGTKPGQNTKSGTSSSKTKTSGTRSRTYTSPTYDEDSAKSALDNSDTITSGDLVMTEGEKKYNYSKSEEITKFTIENKSRKTRRYQIIIEESQNYDQYGLTAITDFSPEGDYYVKFQANVGSTLIPPKTLHDAKLNNMANGKKNYLIYEGRLAPRDSTVVSIVLYIDYEPLDNKFQDKSFIGTIRLYYVSDN